MSRASPSSPIPADAAISPAGPASARGKVSGGGRLRRRVLASPSPFPAAPRRFFSPVTGPLRRLERAISLALSRRFFPWVPGMDLPAHLQLRHGLVVSGAEIALRPLPSALAGTRLLLITDVHAGPFLSPETLQGALARLLALAPDLILLGGDLVTSRVEEVRAHLPALGSLRAPLGVFAVLGNHDHYTGHPALLRELLGGAGIQVLHNEAVPVRRDGSSFVLAGIDDLNVGKPDLEGALADAYRRDPGAPVILLSHNPDVFPEAARRGVALVLSGHTHGGQIRVPGFPAPVRMSRYGLDEGRFSLARSELVVSRGLGVSGVPFRVACSSEAVLITLRNGVVAAGDPLGGR